MCALFGAYNIRKAAEFTAIGLHSQQHRAIDFAGIVSSDGTHLYRERGVGVVRQVFSGAMLDRLHGKHAIGHTRYPTLDDDVTRDNIQPLQGSWAGMPIAIAHNGNLTNLNALEKMCPQRTTSLDTEYILRLLEMQKPTSIEKNLADVCNLLEGSYSLVLLLPEAMIAILDPRGVRPLSIGKRGESYFVSSETCAFSSVDAEFLQDVKPGTICIIDKEGVREFSFAKKAQKKCPFEGIYFAHPSSDIYNGVQVTDFRLKLGAALERHCPCPEADIVTEVPDSGRFHAMGYAASGMSGTYMPVILRNHYVGRSFIASSQALRDEEVDGKFNFTASLIKGKSIVVIDDSVVRGTTMVKIIAKLWTLGAREVHVRIPCPLIKFLCVYGIYMKGKDGRLVAQEKSVEDIRQFMGATSLQFLPLEVLKEVWPNSEDSCFACMDGSFWHQK